MIRQLLRCLLLLSLVMQGMAYASASVANADAQQHCADLQATVDHGDCCNEQCVSKSHCVVSCAPSIAITSSILVVACAPALGENIALAEIALRALVHSPPYPPPIA